MSGARIPAALRHREPGDRFSVMLSALTFLVPVSIAF